MASQYTENTSADSFPYQDWMRDLPSDFHAVPLNRLAIPGSHNSCTYHLDKSGPLGPDLDSGLHGMQAIFGQMIKEIIYKWSVTQSLDVTMQLSHGIRYFDIRLACKPESNEVHIVHGLFGMKLSDTLEQIVAFLDVHPKEVIFLDFHENYLTKMQQEQCLDMIAEKLGNKCCPRLDVGSLTLETMWENELQVIAFHKEDMVQEDFRFWSREVMPRPWPRVSDVKQVINFLETTSCKRSGDTFHGTQGVISPDTGFILGNMGANAKEQMGLQVAKPFVSWLKTKTAGIKGINICMMDFVELEDYIPSVLALNKKPAGDTS